MRTSSLLLGFPAVLVCSLVGCGGDATVTPGSGAGGAGGGGSGAGPASSGSVGPATTGTASGAGGGAACGAGKSPCPATDYCDAGDGKCGTSGAPGTCTPRPMECGKNLQPACACDGIVYDNPCLANQAGFDLNDAGCGGGSSPAGFIPCGSGFCDTTTSYCEVITTNERGAPWIYTCKQLPAGCSSSMSDCSCFPDTRPCKPGCHIVLGGGVGGFELVCQGV